MGDDKFQIRVVVSANEIDGPPEVRAAMRARIRSVMEQAVADALDATAEAQIEIEISSD